MKNSYTDEERKEYGKKWRENHPNYYKEYGRKYRKEYKDRDKTHKQKWIKEHPQQQRAIHLLYGYNKSDIIHNRGKGDLTAQWIIDNIFTQPCRHCGITGWDKIGCNRLNNDLPHTIDNVEPCCWECNRKIWNESKKNI